MSVARVTSRRGAGVSVCLECDVTTAERCVVVCSDSIVHTLSSFNLYEDAIQEPLDQFDELSDAISDPTTQ